MFQSWRVSVALIVLSSLSLAHSPRMVIEGAHLSFANAYAIPDASISWALYAKLPAKSIEWYRADLKAGQVFYVSMTVPQIRGLEDFAPSFAIVGKGLAASKLEFVPEGMGAIVVPPSPATLEVHAGHGYWVRQNTTIKIPFTGTYFVAVFHATGRAGKYVLAPGRTEVFVNQGRASNSEIDTYFGKP